MGKSKENIFIFSTVACPHCKAAKTLLTEKRVKYFEINLTALPEARDKMVEIAGRRTVPQIFFNRDHIGGNDDLQNLEKQGELDDLLFQAQKEEVDKNSEVYKLHKQSKKASSEKKKQDDEKRLSRGKRDEETQAEKEEGDDDEIEALLSQLRSEDDGVEIKSRTYHMKSYAKCFVGTQLVDWFAENLNLSREDAVDYGQNLMDAHVFNHVCFSEPFKDGKFFYRFQADEEDVVLNFGKLFLKKNVREASVVSGELRERILDMHEKFIGDEGVNYTKLKASSEFEAYVNATSELQRVDIASLSRPEKLAFFINIYNSLVIHGFAVIGPPTGPFQRSHFFSSVSYNIGGHNYSLNDIEHGILRGNAQGLLGKGQFALKDPRRFHCFTKVDQRIHFALVCGAKSCPPVKVYNPENVEQALTWATEAFIEDEVTVKGKKVRLSKLFDWYHVDFGKKDKDMIHWIAQYCPEEKKVALEEAASKKLLKVKYNTYNWAVNESH